MSDTEPHGEPSAAIAPVGSGEWEILAWLWQLFRHDLATVVNGLPYADGRYQHARLPTGPDPDSRAYLMWRPHPNTGEQAPIGFATVGGLTGARRSIGSFWIAPAARRSGAGSRLALHVIGAHPGPWTIAFQADNDQAAAFWRRTADEAFGEQGWTEQPRAVPGKPHLPPDHWIEQRAA